MSDKLSKTSIYGYYARYNDIFMFNAQSNLIH